MCRIGTYDFTTAKIIGKGILLASIQVAIGSVEMSSKFSVLSFAKDQDTLQRAADALTSYIIIGTFWAIGSSLVLYGSYGMLGILSSMISNLFIMAWIVFSYLHAFQKACDRFNLQFPSMFASI